MSMLGLNMINKLSKYVASALGNNHPFGGLGIVICGDFFQLPPVLDSPLYSNGKIKKTGKISDNCLKGMQIYNYIVNNNVVVLDVIKRTENGEYAELQEKVRLGLWSNNVVNSINERVGAELKLPSDVDENDIDYDYEPTPLVKNKTRQLIYES